jgi:hypothetical protein
VSATTDAFARAATALADAWRRDASLFQSSPTRVVNELLDACGSDHRPLVNLLLSIDATLRARFTEGSTTDAWEMRRAPLVHHLVATRYLQPDVARWVVDAWGAALGVGPATVSRPALSYDLEPVDSARGASFGGGGSTRGHGAGFAATPSPSVRRATVAMPTPRTGGRSVATMRPAGMMATTNTTATARPVPRARSTGMGVSPLQAAQAQRTERIWFGVMAATGLLVFVAGAIGIANRKSAAATAAAILPNVTAAVRAIDGQSMLPLPPADPLTAPVVSANPSEPARMPVRTPTDTATITANADGNPATALSAVATGLRGVYRVQQRVRVVDGSASCASIAAVLAPGRTSIERIEHQPGSREFALATRSVKGTVDANGAFAIGPTVGTTDGIRWQFSMRGRFTTTGFVAETQTETNAIIRWGRTQQCMTLADLVAERITR